MARKLRAQYPHAHHILFKLGRLGEQRALVQEGQAILKRKGIDPIFGRENLTWAPRNAKGQHGTEALRNVVESLRRVEKDGGSREDIVAKLQQLGEIAAARKKTE